MRPFYFILFFGIFLFSSQTKSPRRIRIEAEVKKKVERFRKSKQDKCDQSVMFRAIEIVDSTLLIRAKVKLSNVVQRPTKPDKPNVKNAKDTLPVNPLFN